MEFEGRVAVITGGASGIGRAAVDRLVERGAAVAILDRDGPAVVAAAREVVALGGRAIALPTDVASETSVAAAVGATLEAFGRIDFLFANAAIHRFGTVLDTSPDTWDELLGVNLRGAYLCARACLPVMVEQGSGVIVATSSDCAVRTCAESVGYVVSKHGLIGLIRSIAVDFGSNGIRANVVVPGVTETPGLMGWYSVGDRTPEEGMRRAATLSPLGRVGRASEVAEAAAFLFSDRASFITGAVLMADGGMTVTYGAD